MTKCDTRVTQGSRKTRATVNESYFPIRNSKVTISHGGSCPVRPTMPLASHFRPALEQTRIETCLLFIIGPGEKAYYDWFSPCASPLLSLCSLFLTLSRNAPRAIKYALKVLMRLWFRARDEG